MHNCSSAFVDSFTVHHHHTNMNSLLSYLHPDSTIYISSASQVLHHPSGMYTFTFHMTIWKTSLPHPFPISSHPCHWDTASHADSGPQAGHKSYDRGWAHSTHAHHHQSRWEESHTHTHTHGQCSSGRRGKEERSRPSRQLVANLSNC